jgi:hypothetical protein
VVKVSGFGDDAALINDHLSSRLIVRSGLLVLRVDYTKLDIRAEDAQAAMRRVMRQILGMVPAKGH